MVFMIFCWSFIFLIKATLIEDGLGRVTGPFSLKQYNNGDLYFDSVKESHELQVWSVSYLIFSDKILYLQFIGHNLS